MISVYQLEQRVTTHPETLPVAKDPCWINLSGPTHNELHQLHHAYGIPMEFLTAALDPDERARFEVEDDVQLFLLRIPIAYEPQSPDEEDAEILPGVPYITRPLGLIFAQNVIISVCSKENTVIGDFLEAKVKAFDPRKRSRFLLQVFHRTVLKYLRFLKDIDLQTNRIEQELQQNLKNEDVIRLMNQEKSLVYFTTSLRSNHFMFKRLRKSSVLKPLTEDDKELFEDVMLDCAQAIHMAGIYTNILNGLMDAFASVINNNLNHVMKSLTKITIILMLPTLVASIYGMNVGLPFQNSPWAFAIVMFICFLAGGIGWALFSLGRRY